ncbi:EamA-like transporter family protein [Bryocella elongata]|uniref:EamA-like transporter family protein n=1 Tax=Bryocella elongata TaxID=863522 RepID=A0A1H6C0E6_9BACT|nr:DMT family transporter [Bryocella elongata]SEG66382.1 EamA-like transporter family protein [Bryocella elongata]
MLALRLERRCSAPAILLLMAANLLWAGQGVAVKLLVGGPGPLTIALAPLYCITVVALIALSLRGGFAARLRAACTHWREFVLAGIAGQLMAQVGMTLGVTWSTASNGAILSLLIPIFGAVIAVWLLQERLTSLRLGALLLGFAGVFLLSPLHRATGAGMPVHELAGNCLIAIGCFGSAFYNVYSKRLLESFTGIETLFFSYLATTLFSLPLLFALEPHCLQALAHLTLRQWGAFGYLAIFLYGVSMVLFLRALGSVDVIVASASLYLVPLFGVALAFCVLGERLAPRVLVGSVIVLLATVMIFRYDYAV